MLHCGRQFCACCLGCTNFGSTWQALRAGHSAATALGWCAVTASLLQAGAVSRDKAGKICMIIIPKVLALSQLPPAISSTVNGVTVEVREQQAFTGAGHAPGGTGLSPAG